MWKLCSTNVSDTVLESHCVYHFSNSAILAIFLSFLASSAPQVDGGRRIRGNVHPKGVARLCKRLVRPPLHFTVQCSSCNLSAVDTGISYETKRSSKTLILSGQRGTWNLWMKRWQSAVIPKTTRLGLAAEYALLTSLFESLDNMRLPLKICPGRHLVHSSAWILMASFLATMNITKAVDANGKKIEPEIRYENSIFR